MSDLKAKDAWMKKGNEWVKPGNKKCFVLYSFEDQQWILKNIETYKHLLKENKRKFLPSFILERTIPSFRGNFQLFEKKFNLKNFEIIAYSIRRKPNFPIVFCIAKKNEQFKVIKIGLHKKAKAKIKHEYNIIKKFDKLNAEFKDEKLIMDYISGKNAKETGTEGIKRAIEWLAEFHSKNSSGIRGIINGDFSPHDVLFINNKIVVVDWEDWDENGNQLFDIFGFIHKLNSKERAEEFLEKILEGKLIKLYLEKRGIKISKKEKYSHLLDFCKYNLKRNRATFGYDISNNKFFNKLEEIIKQVSK